MPLILRMVATLVIVVSIFILLLIFTACFCCGCGCLPLVGCCFRLSFLPFKAILFSKYSLALQIVIYVPFLVYTFVKCSSFDSCSTHLMILSAFTIAIGTSFFIHCVRIVYTSALIISKSFFLVMKRHNTKEENRPIEFSKNEAVYTGK